MNADTELFPADVGRMDSPELIERRRMEALRGAWVKKHGILTHYSVACPESLWLAILPMADEQRTDVGAIMAEWCRIYDETGRTGYGMTEEEALIELATKASIPLWTEERTTP